MKKCSYFINYIVRIVCILVLCKRKMFRSHLMAVVHWFKVRLQSSILKSLAIIWFLLFISIQIRYNVPENGRSSVYNDQTNFTELTAIRLHHGVSDRPKLTISQTDQKLNQQQNPTLVTIQNSTSTLTYKNTTSMSHEHMKRKDLIAELCNGKEKSLFGRSSMKRTSQNIHILKEFNLLYCRVPKVGSTFWSRLIYALKFHVPIQTPYDIPIKKALKSIEMTHISRRYDLLKNRMLFVREPFNRLLSGYIDKLFAPNPYYWSTIGQYIIRTFRENPSARSKRCGHDVTFPEFIKYVIHAEQNTNIKARIPRDIHFSPTYDQCKPCEIHYNIIGKMESFMNDTAFILNKIGFNISEQHFKEWAVKAEEDAIMDSTISPFEWKTKIKRCMSMYEAGLRIWRKVQIRGIIDIEEPLPFDRQKMKIVTSHDFITALMNARQRSKHNKKQQKQAALIDAFNQVSSYDKMQFREMFLPDFKLFGYNSKPTYIFNSSIDVKLFKTKYFDFLN